MNSYHWTGAAQRIFVETLSETGSVVAAADEAGMSRHSAYRLRNRRGGKLFRIGWDAAVRLSRIVIADRLMERALMGEWTESVRDKDSGVTRRHARNYRLGLAMLTRLDRLVEASAIANSPDMAAQIAEQDFEAYLDVMEAGDMGAARDFFDARRDDWNFGHYTPDDPLFAEDWEGENDGDVCHLPQNSGENAGGGNTHVENPPPSGEGDHGAQRNGGGGANDLAAFPLRQTTQERRLPPPPVWEDFAANHCNLPQNSNVLARPTSNNRAARTGPRITSF